MPERKRLQTQGAVPTDHPPASCPKAAAPINFWAVEHPTSGGRNANRVLVPPFSVLDPWPWECPWTIWGPGGLLCDIDTDSIPEWGPGTDHIYGGFLLSDRRLSDTPGIWGGQGSDLPGGKWNSNEAQQKSLTHPPSPFSHFIFSSPQ